ncbi:MAG: hypothetical protein DDT32_01376 [Syntrophomonadaceae bacterium]|nr:hypothetical protein [Bacillota bacterium]
MPLRFGCLLLTAKLFRKIIFWEIFFIGFSIDGGETNEEEFRNNVGACLSFFLSSCAREGEKGVVTLRWVSDPNPLRKEQIARFEKANPGIKVNLDWGSQGMEKVLTQIAGGNPPDLFAIYYPEHLRIFAGKRTILDLFSLSLSCPGFKMWLQVDTPEPLLFHFLS